MMSSGYCGDNASRILVHYLQEVVPSSAATAMLTEATATRILTATGGSAAAASYYKQDIPAAARQYPWAAYRQSHVRLFHCRTRLFTTAIPRLRLPHTSANGFTTDSGAHSHGSSRHSPLAALSFARLFHVSGGSEILWCSVMCTSASELCVPHWH